MADRKILWNEAGKAGLVLGGISIAYLLAGWGLGSIDKSSTAVGILVNVTNVILWVAKFMGCLYLMRYFMKKYAAMDPEVGNNDTFKFGTAAALTSALVYSAAYMAYLMFLVPDLFSSTIDAMASSLDSNTMEQIQNMLPKMPVIAFFVNMVYCFLFGTVVASIFSRNIPSTNPFDKNSDNDKIDEQ